MITETQPKVPTSVDYVVMPVATRDFLLQAMRETAAALNRTNRLRATTHILLEEGIRLTQSNSFQIDHQDALLLMNLAERLLKQTSDATGCHGGPGCHCGLDPQSTRAHLHATIDPGSSPG